MRMFVTIGFSIFLNSRPIFSSTSCSALMVTNVPRPASAALRMNQLFGAEPMPTVNKRDAPRRSPMNLNSSSSLPTLPSVTKITCFRNSLSASVDSARCSAGRISVPPLALSPET